MAAGEVLLNAAELGVTPHLTVLRRMAVQEEAHGAVALWPEQAMATPRVLEAAEREAIPLAALAARMGVAVGTRQVMGPVTARQALAAAAAEERAMTAVTAMVAVATLAAVMAEEAVLLLGMALT